MSENSHTRDDLRILQALPLDMKITRTKQRLKEWVDYYGVDGVYVSFSGGKDSTVLLDIARSMYPQIEAVFVNTGLEYPEIQSFVKTFDNVTILYPKKTFMRVLADCGYPLLGKEIASAIRGAKRYLDALERERERERRTGFRRRMRLPI